MRSVDIARMAIGAGVFALVSGATLAASKVEQDAPMATPLGITVQSVGKAYYTPGNALLSSIGQKAYNYADAAGMTLYTYEKDQNTPGKSACIGECATLWLPLIAPANIKPDALWSTITRDDGSKQWALRGKPLYRHAKDTLVGHDLGRGAEEGGWQLAAFNPASGVVLPAGMGFEEVPDALGQVLVNERDHVLYAYSGDQRRETPRCGDIPCRWDAAAAPQLAIPIGDFSVITRPDQTRQWAYKRQPLFTYSGDFESGYAAGIGVDKKMNVVVLARYFMPSNATLQVNSSQGTVLADADGKTLYRRDTWVFQQGGHGIRRGVPPRPRVGRTVGTSMEGCDEKCQLVWRPFKAPDGAMASGFWQITTRDDGTRQWVYKGYALYTYAGDKKPGDIRGTDYYDFILSLDPTKETVYPIQTFGMGGLAWLYAFP